MPPQNAARRDLAPARVRLLAAVALGLVCGVPLSVWAGSVLGALVGWDILAAAYVTWAWLGARRLDSAAVARLANREDPGKAATDVLLLTASVASLVGVGLVIIASGSTDAPGKDLRAGLAVASVVLSWALVHTIFSERYVQLYYRGPVGGVDFNQTDPPCYTDFLYLAFTIGMTFQVSDTSISSGTIRATALRHALLSYLFGAIIIAATINLLAGLAS